MLFYNWYLLGMPKTFQATTGSRYLLGVLFKISDADTPPSFLYGGSLGALYSKILETKTKGTFESKAVLTFGFAKLKIVPCTRPFVISSTSSQVKDYEQYSLLYRKKETSSFFVLRQMLVSVVENLDGNDFMYMDYNMEALPHRREDCLHTFYVNNSILVLQNKNNFTRTR